MDTSLFRTINELQTDSTWLNGLGLFYAKTAGPLLLALLLLVGFAVARRKDLEHVTRAGWAGLSTFVAVGLNQPIVHAFDRARPYARLHDVHLLGTPSTDPSFPSDHATLAGAAIAGLFLVDRRLGWAATAVGLLLCADRVYIGAHYPADVLAGLTLGAAVALVGWIVLRRPLVALVTWLAGTRLRPLITA
ncbi:MAG: phosphatase PAP2 family protein [Actinomycetota bacterium]|nr:phosphatase PAP2 family protein [Actinomycetota bacterium]